MGLTPNEIRNHEFSSSFRGFSQSEVEAFKEAAASALEEAKVEILKLTEEKESLETKYSELKGIEETLKTTVIEAQKNAEQIIANAKKEAELILVESKQKRDTSIEEKHRELSEIETRIHDMGMLRKSFYARLKGEIEAYLKLVSQFESVSSEGNPSPSNPEQSQPPTDTNPDSQVNQGEKSDIDEIVEQFRRESEGREN
jgi:cell division initiation protein